MRLAYSFGAGLALSLATATAFAQIHEPNGLGVPIDSSPEIQLYSLFSSRSENINWQTDDHVTPASFSPLCGFTATYVLNQAGSHFGLAWYNDTGTPPQPSQLYQLVAPNSPVGTTFNGTVIKNDPNYMGGLVGFALVGGETHYTNSAYDTVCTSCSPAAPWITALMYASTVTPNAYYVCFEDGGTSSSGWNNDGDFNDDVYFVTGITCQGGGVPCMTGKPGICGPGLTECTAGGTTCHELNPPAAHETCNGLDDDCNGQVDEGNPCPASFVCVQGSCVHACNGTEFECAPPTICATNGYCEDPKCVNVTCPSGQVCVQGLCKAPCDGVTCPFPQTCRVGKCVDPCAGVTCMTGQVCTGGVCVANCGCTPCGQGEACDATSGLCVTAACKGVTCSAGKHCSAGNCVDDCSGAACPAGQMCTGGNCVPLPDAGAGGDAGGGLMGPGGDDGGSGSGDGGSSSGGGSGAGGDFGGGRKAGCGCRVVGLDTGSDVLAWIGAGAALMVVTRRTRRRRR